MADVVIGEIEEIKNTDNGKEIHWKIPHFHSLAMDCYYKCPDFKFLNIQWNLKIGPSEMFTNDGEIALLLKTGETDYSYDVMCTFGIIKDDGSIIGITSLKHTLHPQEKNLDVTLIVHKFFATSEFFEHESELLPLSNLTIMCNLKLVSDPVIPAGNMKFISVYNFVYIYL